MHLVRWTGPAALVASAACAHPPVAPDDAARADDARATLDAMTAHDAAALDDTTRAHDAALLTDAVTAADVAAARVTVSRAGSDDFADQPQYIAMRKAPTQGRDVAQQARCVAAFPALAGLPFYGNADTCVIFNAGIVRAIPDATQRRAVMTQGFAEVRARVGHEHVGRRQLAMEFFVDVLNADADTLVSYVSDALAAARAARLPVLIAFDAVNWWGGRPDLWNFFDATAPGYDPANVNNVEWTGYTPATATRVFWRDWGSQIRVATPVPDFASVRYRAAIRDVAGRLLPVIRTFLDGLAPDERYLYAGTIVGTEIGIGSNHYFYPNGNAYLAQPAACDPGLRWSSGSGCPAPSPGGACAQFNHNACGVDFSTGSLSGGEQQLGFRAAQDLGLLHMGDAMTLGVLDAVVADYVAFVDGLLISAGLPAQKVYTHLGAPQSLRVARVGDAVAGWSMYYGGAQDPRALLGSLLDSSASEEAAPWSSPEWLPLSPNGSDSPHAWFDALEAGLGYRNNRLISVANWEGVSNNPRALAAFGQSLSAPPAGACVVSPRVLLGTASFTGRTGLRFTVAEPGTTTYLNASHAPTLDAHGGLATIDVFNGALDAGASVFFASTDGATVYVQLVTDGCPRDGSPQRMRSSVYTVRVHASGAMPTGPVLYVRADDPIVSFAWDRPASLATTPAMLQIATDAAFADVSATDVTAHAVFYRDGFAPGRTYYARLRFADGRLSNVVTVAR